MAVLSCGLVICVFLGNILVFPVVVSADWCVVRSDASYQALQTALDFACAAGADCTPIQSNGLCFLPNTIQAHASYAFNSYFQRKGMAPGSCDFNGTSNVARTDPSYGSCVYPSSLSTAGGAPATASTTPATTTSPNTQTVPAFGGGNSGLKPGSPPAIPMDNANACEQIMVAKGLIICLGILLVLSFTFPPML